MTSKQCGFSLIEVSISALLIAFSLMGWLYYQHQWRYKQLYLQDIQYALQRNENWLELIYEQSKAQSSLSDLQVFIANITDENAYFDTQVHLDLVHSHLVTIHVITQWQDHYQKQYTIRLTSQFLVDN